MSDYILSCCSTADLTAEHFAARNISYICFHFQLDGVSYPDDLGQSVPFEDFYRKMTEGAETKTSQINISEYLDYFEGFLKAGKDVLHVDFSSGLSGSFASASNAAAIARERYPERKLLVLDSLAASSGYGLLMDKAADLRDAGMGIDELAQWVDEHKKYLHHWFFSTDLTFYIKGGRVSKTSGAIAGVLGICPLLDMDDLGRLTPRMKIRSKKKVKEKIVEQMLAYAENGRDYSGKCYISQSACYDDAKDVADMVEAAFPKLNGKVEINYVGTLIGSHTGPGTVALFFWADPKFPRKR
jgi:DegV family protein with EDD domain